MLRLPTPHLPHWLACAYCSLALALFTLLLGDGNAGTRGQDPASGSNLECASHRQQRASRDLHGAMRYMDRNSNLEAQNVLEEDDDQRGQLRLA